MKSPWNSQKPARAESIFGSAEPLALPKVHAWETAAKAMGSGKKPKGKSHSELENHHFYLEIPPEIAIFNGNMVV